MQIVGGALDDELINLFIAGILTAGIMLATRCMSAAQVRHPPAEGKRAATLLRVRVAPQLRMTEKGLHATSAVLRASTAAARTKLRC
jgi:hypothetical protein